MRHPFFIKSAFKTFGIFAGVALAVVGVVMLSIPKEPIYKGKRLSFYLERIYGADSGDDQKAAEDAIRQIGEPAVPFLLRRLSRPHRLTWLLVNKVHSLGWCQSWMTELEMAKPRELGIAGLNALGSKGISASPKLREMLNRRETKGTAISGLVAIEDYDPLIDLLSKEELFLQPLLYALASPKTPSEAVQPLTLLISHEEPDIRSLVAYCLGEIAKEPAIALPALIKLAEDPVSWVRENAAESLAKFEHRGSLHASPPEL